MRATDIAQAARKGIGASHDTRWPLRFAWAAFFSLAACGPRDRDASDYLADWRGAAVHYCLGDGAPPALGEQSSGGELAACQALVRGGRP